MRSIAIFFDKSEIDKNTWGNIDVDAEAVSSGGISNILEEDGGGLLDARSSTCMSEGLAPNPLPFGREAIGATQAGTGAVEGSGRQNDSDNDNNNGTDVGVSMPACDDIISYSPVGMRIREIVRSEAQYHAICSNTDSDPDTVAENNFELSSGSTQMYEKVAIETAIETMSERPIESQSCQTDITGNIMNSLSEQSNALVKKNLPSPGGNRQHPCQDCCGHCWARLSHGHPGQQAQLAGGHGGQHRRPPSPSLRAPEEEGLTCLF